jgi:hypothetical protein
MHASPRNGRAHRRGLAKPLMSAKRDRQRQRGRGRPRESGMRLFLQVVNFESRLLERPGEPGWNALFHARHQNAVAKMFPALFRIKHRQCRPAACRAPGRARRAAGQALLRAIERAASIASIRARPALAPALASLKQTSMARRAALSAASRSSPEWRPAARRMNAARSIERWSKWRVMIAPATLPQAEPRRAAPAALSRSGRRSCPWRRPPKRPAIQHRGSARSEQDHALLTAPDWPNCLTT